MSDQSSEYRPRCEECGDEIMGMDYHTLDRGVLCEECWHREQSFTPNTRPDDHTGPLDYSKIDPDVRALVRDLRESGFETTASCQGGPGHAMHLPSVTIAAEDLEAERDRLIEWVQERDLAAIVRVEYLVQSEYVMDESHLMLRLWTRDHRWTQDD